MYDVPQYKPEIKLISNVDGVVGVYPDYETFLDNIEYFFVECHVVTTFKNWPGRWVYYWKWCEQYPKYMVRDKCGSVFSPTEILQELSKKIAGIQNGVDTSQQDMTLFIEKPQFHIQAKKDMVFIPGIKHQKLHKN